MTYTITHKITHKITLSPAEQFFYDHAGWSYTQGEPAWSGRTRGAVMLAFAEQEAQARNWQTAWEYDPDGADCTCGDDHGPAYMAVLTDEDGRTLGILGGVTFATRSPDGDPYARVVSAELASEALSEVGQRDD